MRNTYTIGNIPKTMHIQVPFTTMSNKDNILLRTIKSSQFDATYLRVNSMSIDCGYNILVYFIAVGEQPFVGMVRDDYDKVAALIEISINLAKSENITYVLQVLV